MSIEDKVNYWLSLTEEERTTSDNAKHCLAVGFASTLRNILCQSDKKTYIYMVTFTISPKLHPNITPSLVKEIEDYIISQSQRTAMKLTAFEYVKEFHKSGAPHWHVLISSTVSLKKSLFSYYQKLYGNLDFSQTKGKTDQEIKTYISKDNKPTKLI
jgi:hypothetical protein